MPESAKVEAVGGQLVVWSEEGTDRELDEPMHRLMACRRSTGTRVQVFRDYHYSCSVRTTRVAAAGRFVAYAQDVCRSNQVHREQTLYVGVLDAVRRRKVTRRRVAFNLPPERPPFLSSTIDALLVTRGGSAAFVVRHPTGRPYRSKEIPVGVRALDAGGRRLLDKGEGIDPASLRLDGSTVHWTNAGEARSAPLRDPPAQRR